MKKISYTIFFLIFVLSNFKSLSANETDIYKKIDLFSEVLEKINNEYVEDVNQGDAMDAAINGVLQSLDPYSSYMSPEMLKEMQTETKGEFGKKSAFSLDLTTSQNEPRIERLFDVPLINTSIADFALSLQYCTSLLDSSNEPVENIVLCNSAVNNTISILDATTGSSLLNISVPENRDSWDMTQYSYQAFCL